MMGDVGTGHGGTVAWVLARLAAQGASGWLVGGAVRDQLLGRPVLDLDIAVPAGAVPLAGALAQSTGGTRVVLDEARDIARVVWPGHPPRVLDIAALTAPTIDGDLAGRDFTINALAVPLAAAAAFGPGDVLDPTGGLADLRAGIVRMTSAQALEADPLRMLRAVRLAAELGFDLEPATAAAIAERAGRVAEPAGERVREELLRTVAAPRAAVSVARLGALGLLAIVLPEVAAGAGVGQSPPHDRDVLAHTLAVLDAVEAWQQSLAGVAGPAAWPECWRRLAAAHAATLEPWFAHEGLGGRPRWTALRLAALLHDIGKPVTWAVDEASGRIRFLGHDVAGARLVQGIGQRLHLSQREIGYLATVTAEHLRPLALARSGPPSRRVVFRYFRATGAAGVDVALLALADAAGKAAVAPDEAHALADVAERLWRAWFTEQASVVRPPPLVRGDEVMAALGIGPGPLLGRLLAGIQEGQAAGEVTDVAGALALARRLRQQYAGDEAP